MHNPSSDRRELTNFLAAYWDQDASGDDDAIVAQIIQESPPQFVDSITRNIRQFLESSEPADSKATLIRETTWLRFPYVDPDGPVHWLGTILERLERSTSNRQSDF